MNNHHPDRTGNHDGVVALIWLHVLATVSDYKSPWIVWAAGACFLISFGALVVRCYKQIKKTNNRANPRSR